MTERMQCGKRNASKPSRIARQAGVYAVEFGIVFPIFFLLFYGILTFGLIFTAQHSLMLAAEDGARASLRYLIPPSGSDSTASFEEQVRGQLQHGCDIAAVRAAWVGQMAGENAAPNCEASVTGPCRQADGSPGGAQCTITLDGTSASAIACGYQTGQQCQAKLVMTYGYRAHPLVPSLPLASLATPQTITGVATVTLDPATLQMLGSGA